MIIGDNLIIRNDFANFIYHIFSLKSPANEALIKNDFRLKVINLLAFEMWDLVKSTKHVSRVFKYYETLFRCIQTCDAAAFEKNIDFWNMLESFIEQLYAHESLEVSSAAIDYVLYGTLWVINITLRKFPQWRSECGEKLLKYLLHDCLFEIPQQTVNSTAVRPPKCKHQHTRTMCLKLVNVLCRNVLKNLQFTIHFLADLH